MSAQARGWGTTVTAVVVGVALAAGGATLARRAPVQRGFEGVRFVAVSDAAAAAAERDPVRLQGTIGGATVLTAPDGHDYALQYLEIAHGDGDDRLVDYRRLLPGQLLLGDADSLIVVDPTDLDIGLLPVIAEITTSADGALAPDLAVHLVPGFTDRPVVAGATATLRGIDAGAPVVAYGTLVLQEGVPALVRPANGDPFVISPLTFSEVERTIAHRDRIARGIGWVLVALGVVIAGGAVLLRAT